MQLHAIQTGTVAIKQNQRVGKGQGAARRLNMMLDRVWTEPLPIYAWVIEHPEGLIVVDTGETSQTSQPGYFPAWHPYFKLGVREWVKPDEEIGSQLKLRGLSTNDVRWVIMTHLHTDHAGGLSHFPKAEFLVSPVEYQQAAGFRGQINGYVSQHFPAWFKPTLIDYQPKPLGPFPASYQVTRAADLFIVPTGGHTAGHQSIVLMDGDQVVFLAGDTSYTQQIMLNQQVDGVSPNEQAAKQTLARILEYAHQVPLIYLTTHDAESGQRLAARQTVC